MSLSVGDRLGRYEVLGPIGAGGMGEVWRASDSELGREVAVKVLPEAVAADPTRLERFRREARALAALSHPNLLDVYDVGASNGLNYVITELLEGDSLRRRITTSGLPWQKAAEIGAAVADGLAAAHGKGIVHRDLKPENLFVTNDGRVKILDFGLARMDEAVEAEAETGTLTPPVTETGVIMGTPGYMAPEQVKGRTADSRSDIFALGCVLYEMVAGRRAFGGDSSMEVMAAILKEEPPQLSSTDAMVPEGLERSIHRCLEKHPEARFQSAADLAYSLRSASTASAAPVSRPVKAPREAGSRRWWLAAGAAVLLAIVAAVVSQLGLLQPGAPEIELVRNRIAVVPFENRTGDPSLDSLGAMAADRIGQGLAEVTPVRAAGMNGEVSVVPDTVVQEILNGGAETTPRAIGAATGAGIVVTGSYYLDGDGLSFGITITDALSEEVIRAIEAVTAPRDAAGKAIQTLRDRAFIVVTDHLSPILGAFADNRFTDIEAYRLFITALHHLGTGQFQKAVELVQKMLAIDPDFNRVRMWLLMVNPAAVMDELLERSDELTENQLIFVEARQADLDFNREKSYRLYRTLLDRAPDNRMIAMYTMGAAMSANRPGVVVEFFERFEHTIDVQLNLRSNSNLAILLNSADAYHLLGRYEEELDVARRWRAIEPGVLRPISAEARALVGLGRLDELEPLVMEAQATPCDCGFPGDFLFQIGAFLRAHGYPKESKEMAERAGDWFQESGLEEQGSEPCESCLVQSLGVAGRLEEARVICERLVAENPDHSAWVFWLGVVSAQMGDRDTAEKMIARFEDFEEQTVDPYEPVLVRAVITAGLGDRDEALRLLREAIASGFGNYVDLHNRPFYFESLRDDPEFLEIVRPKG